MSGWIIRNSDGLFDKIVDCFAIDCSSQFMKTPGYTLRGPNLRFWASLAGCDARRRSRRSANPLQVIGNEAARSLDAAQKRKSGPRKVYMSTPILRKR
jgi:hypothetical protein